MTGWFLHTLWRSRQLRPRIRRNIAGIFLKKIMKTLNHYNRSRLLSIARPNQFILCSSVCLYIYHHLQVIMILIYRMSGLEVYKNTCLCLVPKSFMKFMFPTVYRVTQIDLYARPYTSMWSPVVARQISKRYSSSCHVFISMWGVISSTASMIRCLKKNQISNSSPNNNVLNHLMPNGHFSGRTAPQTYKCCIFYLFNKYTYWIF
jgi:hypothetical protein